MLNTACLSRSCAKFRQRCHASAMREDFCALADLSIGAARRGPAPAAAPKARKLPKCIIYLCSSTLSLRTHEMSGLFFLVSLQNAPQKALKYGSCSAWAQASTVGYEIMRVIKCAQCMVCKVQLAVHMPYLGSQRGWRRTPGWFCSSACGEPCPAQLQPSRRAPPHSSLPPLGLSMGCASAAEHF